MNPISEFSSSSEACAVSIGKDDKGIVHCGLLYKLDNTPYFLHLGNPLHLFNDTENDAAYGFLKTKAHYKWKPFIDIPAATITLIKTRCAAIAESNDQLPYGIFLNHDISFDEEGLLDIDEGDGLTCASFVKVVLKDSGVNIIDNNGWPNDRPEDKIWLDKSIETYTKSSADIKKGIGETNAHLKKGGLSDEKVLELKDLKEKLQTKMEMLGESILNLKGVRKKKFYRYKPEEVSAAAYRSFADIPIKYEYDPTPPKGLKILAEELLLEI